jgi:hypothetical protein
MQQAITEHGGLLKTYQKDTAMSLDCMNQSL